MDEGTMIGPIGGPRLAQYAHPWRDWQRGVRGIISAAEWANDLLAVAACPGIGQKRTCWGIWPKNMGIAIIGKEILIYGENIGNNW